MNIFWKNNKKKTIISYTEVMNEKQMKWNISKLIKSVIYLNAVGVVTYTAVQYDYENVFGSMS